MGLKPRQAILDLPVYTPAKSIDSAKKEYGFDKVIKLAGNENTLGFSPKARKALETLNSYYPDGAAINLREKAAEKFRVKPEQIVFGNGSFELLSLIGMVFLEPGDESLMAVPSFGWYKNVTITMGATLVTVPLTDFKVDLNVVADAVTEKTKVIWLTNPNNPTATIFTETELECFLDKIRDDILVVLDEAYIDFVVEEGYPDSVNLLNRYSNIIILRTFSKLEGLAGFRVGYGISSEEIIGYINKVRLPMNVTAPAQLAALAAFDDDSFKRRTLCNVHQGLEQYYRVLDQWGLKYIKSNTNFLLFETGVDSAYLVEEFLKRGILIRGGHEFGYPTMLRISIGTPQENEAVIKLLAELLNKSL